jgi:hypothetical protein
MLFFRGDLTWISAEIKRGLVPLSAGVVVAVKMLFIAALCMVHIVVLTAYVTAQTASMSL